MNLFEMMKAAGGGEAFASLSKQFGLSEEQVSRAVEAFLPAFSAGLKQNTADPLGLMELMRRLASGEYARAYQSPDWGGAAGLRSGEDAIKYLFGSSDAVNALARQASAFTGLAQEKLAALLPAVAALVLGGLAKQSAVLFPPFEAMMRQYRTASAPGRAGKGPLDRYEDEQAGSKGAGPGDFAGASAEMMQAGLAAFQQGAAAWQDAMGAMMKSTGGGAVAGAPAGEGAKATGQNVFGDLLEPGLRLGEAYQREIEATLERLRSKPKSA